MKVLKQFHPIARKDHRCMFCGGIIKKGEKYDRQTDVDSGEIYDWVNHNKCSKIASQLNMYKDCDDGLDGYNFRSYIDNYIEENHYDYIMNKPLPDWNHKTYEELVEKIYEELKNK